MIELKNISFSAETDGEIKEILNDESKRLAVAVSAYGKVNECHRWINRAQSIVEAMAILEGIH